MSLLFYHGCRCGGNFAVNPNASQHAPAIADMRFRLTRECFTIAQKN